MNQVQTGQDGGLLTPADCAKLCGCSKQTILRRIADGTLKATKLGAHNGRTFRIRREWLDEILVPNAPDPAAVAADVADIIGAGR